MLLTAFVMYGCIDGASAGQIASTGQAIEATRAELTNIVTTDVTIQVPLYRQINAQLLPFQLRGTSGAQGLATEIPSLPVGATITSVRARVTDAISKLGPTKLTLAVASQGDFAIATVSPPSAPSARQFDPTAPATSTTWCTPIAPCSGDNAYTLPMMGFTADAHHALAVSVQRSSSAVTVNNAVLTEFSFGDP